MAWPWPGKLAAVSLTGPTCAGLGLVVSLTSGQPPTLHDGRVQAQEPEPVVVSQPGELSLTILETPQAGTPIELRLSADTIVLPENRLGWEDVVDPQAVQPRIRARIVAPAEPGEYAVRGRIKYITCSTKVCRPRTAHVIWTVVVSAPPDSVETISSGP
jgi:hypothetical protein